MSLWDAARRGGAALLPPQISVVLPAFNAAATLPRAVASVRRQTYTDWELIVVDDGSTDSTPELLRDLALEEPRLRVVTTAHRGIAAALNTGLGEARAEVIARMDADDEAHGERFKEQLSLLQQHRGLGLVSSLVEFGGDRSKAAGYALHVDWMNGLVTPEQIAMNRFVESPFAHPSVMFRRELVERHGGYRQGDFPEDYELWLRWLDAGVVMAKAPRVLLIWHDAASRLSRTDARYETEAFYRCKAAFLARWLRRQGALSRRILVWGAGRPTRQRAEHLSSHGVTIAGYIDIDPRKKGRRLAGREVIGPEDLSGREEVFVLGYVAKRGARDLARAALRSRGFAEGRDFIMAALISVVSRHHQRATLRRQTTDH
jgi:glycosyltransferase involved in cell wall biosynthesis